MEEMMNKELMEALDVLEKEKEISKETLFEAIENSLMTACKNHFGKADNVHVEINRETCDFLVYAEKEVVPTKDDVEDDCLQIALEDAQEISKRAQVGDMIHVEIKSKEFGRIATQNAKNVILQKIREEERSVIYNQYYEKEKDVVTGVVQRYVGKNISINLGKADAMLTENEQVKGEVFKPTERIKVYIVEVKNTPKGPRINVSRTHPELVKRLFESEVTEIKDGTVEIKSIAREAGSRTKIAVWSNNPNVDAVGACVGMNGARVNAIVEELRGEKIDIVNWDENPGNLIQNALSPAKIVAVFADPDEKTARYRTRLSVVSGYHLSSYVSHLWLCIPDSACIQKAEKPSGTSARLPLYCRILPGRIYQRFYPAGFSHVPWDYSGVPHQYKGVIRLDYLPVWFLTGLFFEKILTKSS